MPGLRERKRRKTASAIHDAAMRLFAERGYGAVTITDVAEAAEVSRATVFAYYRSKEDLVLGDAGAAVEALRAALAEGGSVVDAVHGWLRSLAGWIEPEVVLQRRLAEEVPAVAAARSRLLRDIGAVIGDALARELGPADPRAPRRAAAALTAALDAVETEAARRIEQRAAPLAPGEVDELFGAAVAFVDGGLERLRRPARSRRGGAPASPRPSPEP
jgi:AcrR family transcriptional regulator